MTPTPKRRSSLKGRPGRPQVRRGVAELRLGKPLRQDVGKLRLDVANGGEQCFQTLFALFFATVWGRLLGLAVIV